MGRERMTKRVTQRVLLNADGMNGLSHGLLEGAGADMVTLFPTGARINGQILGGKHPIPPRIGPGIRPFLCQRIR